MYQKVKNIEAKSEKEKNRKIYTDSISTIFHIQTKLEPNKNQVKYTKNSFL